MKRWTKCKHFIWTGAWRTTRNGWELMAWRKPSWPFGGWRASVNREGLGLTALAERKVRHGFKTRRGAMRWATDVATGKRTP